ncbi:Thioesterase/thiol ester dehydrase-isomerase [Xylariaceae sp. FL1019]|nr:Thioesterase/thiol ester dehydrase-isomerase [Xylariaceae sp. FL1019]
MSSTAALRMLQGRTLTARSVTSFAFPREASRLQPHRFSSSIPTAPLEAHPKQSLIRRAGIVLTLGVVCTALGFTVAFYPAVPVVRQLLDPPTDKETLSLFEAETPAQLEIDEYIKNHHLAKELRANKSFSESRPHLKIPEAFRSHSLTGGTLSGTGRIEVPPLAFAEEGGKSFVTLFYLGGQLSGHPGIIHGGLIATILDEGMARCCFPVLPHKVGVTATLNINYRKPAMADSYYVFRATTTRSEGRKAWVEGRIETLVPKGETPVVVAEATALFVSPRQAALMTNVYPTT